MTYQHVPLILLGIVAGGLAAGCRSPSPPVPLAQHRPLGADHVADSAAHRVPHAPFVIDPPAPVTTLSLVDAWTLVHQRNPALMATVHEVEAARARASQAERLPNPELELEIEEYDRAGAGFDSAEMVARVAQPFELGGKRHWRGRTAEAEADLAGWDHEQARLDSLAETARRFLDVLVAQRHLNLAETAATLAQEVAQAVGERVRAGKEPPLQASKTGAELEMARIAQDHARADLEVRRGRLAAMWGADMPHFQTVADNLDKLPEVLPEPEILRFRLARNPALARWDTELRKRQAALSLERAVGIPDVAVSVGVHRFEEDETDALAFGLGLPLPLFDRNQDNITAAAHDLSKAESERRAVENHLTAALAAADATLRASYQRVAGLQSRVVPAMEETFEAAHIGYQQGKFGTLDILDARRGLVDAQSALLDAWSAFHGAVVDIEHLTATRLDESANHPPEETR